MIGEDLFLETVAVAAVAAVLVLETFVVTFVETIVCCVC